MPYTLLYSLRALRDLKALPRDIQSRILSTLEGLAKQADPVREVKRLQNSPLYSLRVGSYRVILDIRKRKITIFVLPIGPRRHVYER